MHKKKTHCSKKREEIEPAQIDILYQRLGNKWFAFSLINNEVFVGSTNSPKAGLNNWSIRLTLETLDSTI